MQETSRVLTVRTVDPMGAALAGIELCAERGKWNATATTGPDGRAEIPNVPPGVLWVHTALTGDWIGKRVFLDFPIEEVELKLARTPTLRVRVLDALGQPLEGVTVVSDSDWSHGGGLEARQQTGPDGTCGWRGLLPGQHRLGVSFQVKEGH